jgi:hypothetical protein
MFDAPQIGRQKHSSAFSNTWEEADFLPQPVLNNLIHIKDFQRSETYSPDVNISSSSGSASWTAV